MSDLQFALSPQPKFYVCRTYTTVGYCGQIPVSKHAAPHHIGRLREESLQVRPRARLVAADSPGIDRKISTT